VCARGMTKKSVSAASAVSLHPPGAGTSFTYQSSQVPSRIDADPIVSFTKTFGMFVIDLHGLKVRTSLLSTATRRPKRVKR
jgi:hypothetical protein